jgi:hypothetical protein
MQLLTERDVPANKHDRVFRYSRTRAIVVSTALFGMCAALFGGGVHDGAVGLEIVALVVGGCIFLMRRFLTARFRGSNWLVRADSNGVYVHFRSYLNYHFPPDDATVAFIPYREICSARQVREQRELPQLSQTGRAVSVQTRQLVELELTCDTAPLAGALTQERQRPAPSEKRWYGKTAVKFQHEPVSLPSPSCLRLVWECVPRAESFLTALRSHVSIEKSAALSTRFDDLAGLTRVEQEQRIAELARSGKLVEAITIAQRLYSFDLRRARDYVEALRRSSIGAARAAVGDR